MNQIIKFIICIILLLQCYLIFSQQNTDCGLLSSSSSTTPYKPTRTPVFGQALKILIVYVTFSDDNNPPLYDNFWQPYSLPVSPNGSTGLLATVEANPNLPFMTRYPDYTISDYFCEMSMGQLDVVGKEVLVNLPNSSTFYRTNSLYNSYGKLNKHILQTYVDPMPDVNFVDYDLWSFNTLTQQWEFYPDGTVDMIVMDYRYVPDITGNWLLGGPYSGEASLGYNGSFVLDGKTISTGFGHTEGSGCTGIGQRQKYVLAHC